MAQYELAGLLGSGGMGDVWRGRDPRFDRPVAVKVLHPSLGCNPEIAARFKAEAVIQAKLSHPHIVTVYDFVTDGDHLAIVMELVEGTPLDQLVAKRRIGIPDSIVVMDQVLSAMSFAHSRGLVHRDLKPSNIVVALFGDEPFAKVMDFGIAKILGNEKMRTATSAKMGTLAYMSPEHVRSPKSVDARSDIYSLGATLYEMVTGKVPFDADTEYELMSQVVNEDPPPPRSANAQLPQWLEDVIVRALAKEPNRRYSNCREMQKALRAEFGTGVHSTSVAFASRTRLMRSEETPATAHSAVSTDTRADGSGLGSSATASPHGPTREAESASSEGWADEIAFVCRLLLGVSLFLMLATLSGLWSPPGCSMVVLFACAFASLVILALNRYGRASS